MNISATSNLIIYFSSDNIIAKMTTQTLARKFGGKIPDIIKLIKSKENPVLEDFSALNYQFIFLSFINLI